MATIRGPGKTLVAGQLKKDFFCGFPKETKELYSFITYARSPCYSSLEVYTTENLHGHMALTDNLTALGIGVQYHLPAIKSELRTRTR